MSESQRRAGAIREEAERAEAAAQEADAALTEAKAEAESAAAPWGEPEQLGCEGSGRAPQRRRARAALGRGPRRLRLELAELVGAGFTPARDLLRRAPCRDRVRYIGIKGLKA